MKQVNGCPHCRRPGCRRSRPLCRARRGSSLSQVKLDVKANQRTCRCDGYHFPHRTGSPCCTHNPNASARKWAELEAPIRRAG